jgi:hypothetical protein
MRSLLACFAFLAGCGGSVTTVTEDDASTHDAATHDAANADAGALGDANGTVRCPWENGDPQGPTLSYDKHCASDGDCAIGLHLENCCGQHIALGTNVADAPRFARDGGICGDEYAMCKCLAGGTLAEDGKISMKNGADIVVACVAGVCTTHVAQ